MQRLLMLPYCMCSSAIHVSTHGYAIEQWLPKWDRLLILVTVIVGAPTPTIRGSQRSVLTRDIIANIVNLSPAPCRSASFADPGFPDHFWDASSSLLRRVVGPFWLQVPVLLTVSCSATGCIAGSIATRFYGSFTLSSRVADLKA
jgi:hypothetical protein